MTLKMQQPFYVEESKRWFKKWWPKGVPLNTIFEEKTINELLDEQVDKYGKENFIWFYDAWITYKKFQNYVKSLASALTNLGIKMGDVVALYLPNCPQYIVAYYAITRIGAIASGINPTYQPVEVLHQLDITKPKMLIVLDALYQSSISPIIQESTIDLVVSTNLIDLAEIKGVKKAIGKFIKKIPSGKVDFPGALKFKDLLKAEPRILKVDIDVKKHPATYIMTGGTTGLPKAAVLSHFNVVSNAKQCKLWLGGEKPGIGNIGIMLIERLVSFVSPSEIFIYDINSRKSADLKNRLKINVSETIQDLTK